MENHSLWLWIGIGLRVLVLETDAAVLANECSFDTQRMALNVKTGGQQIEAVKEIRFLASSPVF